jgi:hypothetical protein
VVGGPAVGLVNRDLLLVSVANSHSGDVLLARKLPRAAPDVVTGVLGDASNEARLEEKVTPLRKVECARNGAADGHGVLSCRRRTNLDFCD